ncbi:TPA: hypothetical protein ACKQAW_003389 [Stenotrophomonas maltophilia]
MSLCPYCKNSFDTVRMAPLTATYPGAKSRVALSYNCPSCDASLGIEMDPLAVKTETVAQVIEALQTQKRS